LLNDVIQMTSSPRGGEGGAMAPNAILATFPNRPDPLSFFKVGGLTLSVCYMHKWYT